MSTEPKCAVCGSTDAHKGLGGVAYCTEHAAITCRCGHPISRHDEVNCRGGGVPVPGSRTPCARWCSRNAHSLAADAARALGHAEAEQEHDVEVVHSGAFVRVECGCGWHGGWLPENARNIARNIEAETSRHFWQRKRAEVAKATEEDQ